MASGKRQAEVGVMMVCSREIETLRSEDFMAWYESQTTEEQQAPIAFLLSCYEWGRSPSRLIESIEVGKTIGQLECEKV